MPNPGIDPDEPPARPHRWWAWAGAVGLAAGLLSGLFGVGGGIVMVPLLVAWLALDQRRASATSLLAIVPIATASAAGYAMAGNVDPGAGLVLLLGSVVGGQLGARLLPRVRVATLQLWFGIFSLVTALTLVLDRGTGSGVGPSSGWDLVLLAAVGVAAGVLAGLLGVGGGIIMVPGLVLLAGDDASVARGTSLMVIVLTALTATLTNLRNGLVEVPTALVAGAVGIPAGLLGAAFGQWLPDRIALALFAALLAWSGLRMLRSSVVARRADRVSVA